MVTDPIGDMLIRIKNAQAARHTVLTMPASKIKEQIARVLQENHYIKRVARLESKPFDLLEIELQYEGREPAISHLKRVSKPGSRHYRPLTRLPRPLSGHGLVILSTSKGIMSQSQAQQQCVGGEILATVW